MKNPEEESPIDILIEVAERVESIESTIKTNAELRLSLNEAEGAAAMLKYIQSNPGATSGDVKRDVSSVGHTRQLTKLYYVGYVNRSDKKPYEYAITPKGKLALDELTSDQQSELPDHNDGEESHSEDPWDGTELCKGEYIALRLVNEYDGHPRSGDIEDEYLDHGYEAQSGNNAVAARLSTLYESDGDGYVDRSPKPYQYWLTEKGKDVLKSDD